MFGLKVKKKEGEPLRQELMDKGLLETRYQIKKKGKYLILPLKRKADLKKGEIVEVDFEKQEETKSVKECLKGALTQEELELLPSSYDVIGDILVLDLKEELIDKEKRIGRAFLKTHKNVKVVTRKVGPVEGEFRIQKVKIIAGENRTETLHKENNCRFKLDVNRVFYTPRMARERKLVSERAKSGEKVVDLFAGVGPYSIPIAKTNDVEVIAIEKNKEAYDYLKENIKLNNVGEKVKAYQGGCKQVVHEEELDSVADRIIMNLPGRSEDFLDTAEKIGKKGAVLHFYHFSEEAGLYENIIELIKKRVGEIGILDKRTSGQIAPRKYRVCIDFRL